MSKLVIANFKMNGSKEFYASALTKLNSLKLKDTKLILCPPFVYLHLAKTSKDVLLGVQTVSAEINNKSTGDISPVMMKEFGVKYAIVGHSERRDVGLNDDRIAAKVNNCLENDLIPVICVGESGKSESCLSELSRQVILSLEKVQNKGYNFRPIFAYEPVWAIGSGEICGIDRVNQAISIIRQASKKQGFGCEILYGGSVNEINYKDIADNCEVNGFLVGGLSLKPDKLIELVKGYDNA